MAFFDFLDSIDLDFSVQASKAGLFDLGIAGTNKGVTISGELQPFELTLERNGTTINKKAKEAKKKLGDE